MSYEKELAFFLRQRGMTEGAVAEALAEVRTHSGDDADLIEEFGPAADYAEQFPKRKQRRTPGVVIVTVATLLAIVYAIAKLIAFPYLGITVLDGVGPIRLWPALAIVMAGLVIGFLVDRYRPTPTNALTVPERRYPIPRSY